MKDRQTLITGHIQLQRETPRRYVVNFITAGQNENGWEMPLSVLGASLSQFSGAPCLLNHADVWLGPNITQWAATHENPTLTETGINTTLRIHDTDAGDTLQRIFSAWLDDQEAGLVVAPIGISADLSLRWQPRDDYDQPLIAAEVVKVWSGDAVLNPAAGGAVQRVLNSITPGGITMSENKTTAPQAIPTPPQPASKLTVMQAQLATMSKTMDAIAQRLARQDEADTIQGNGRQAGLRPGKSSLDEVRSAIEYLAGVDGAPIPSPYLRRLDNLYQLTTGDAEWHGVFKADRVTLASANESTLPGLVADAMNKSITQTYSTLPTYRWFEAVVDVEPNDGTLQDKKWITFGGIGDLPNVPYGSAYTELTVDDTSEADSFAVYGGYVGVTRKVLRNSDIARFQAIPRALTIAAIRQRSSKIASLFTVNSGVGPTLDDDSKALFHTDHSNLATTAYSIAGWAAARLECFEQTELGSSKALGFWPAYFLGPADLYDQALIDFGYGAGAGGYTGTANNDVNPYAISRTGDPRPVPIAVPEWTDVNNWAYLVDPKLHPVLKMSYASSPGGRIHPAPELFTVTSPLAGMMFTNDVLPIKVRDEYAYGVADYRGVGKRNVA